MTYALPTVSHSHLQAVLDAQQVISPAEVGAAIVNNAKGRARGFMASLGLYRDSSERMGWRDLFAVAYRVGGVTVAVTYIKDQGEPRTMLCQPLKPNVDTTKRYVTVWDLEAAAYRRVNLDSIIKLNLETGTLEPQCPEAA